MFGSGGRVTSAGNPVAVVHDADGIDDAELAAFARWTNLSETTFLLAPRHADADYRVRILTPTKELPFAGHPTLGSCAAWRLAGGRPKTPGRVVQECAVGLVEIRIDGDARSAFAAPPLARREVDPATLDRALAALGVARARLLAAQWLKNGPDWLCLLLDSAAAVLAVEPDGAALAAFDEIGVAGAHPPGGDAAFEVRAFVGGKAPYEDPVTGSLNAGLGKWLMAIGRAPTSYVAAQGTRLARRGRVHVERDATGRLWIGGETTAVVRGEVDL